MTRDIDHEAGIAATEDGHRVTVELGQTREGRLEFANGAARLSIRGTDPNGDLLRARFRGSPPRVRLAAGAVVVRYPRVSLPLERRRRGAELELTTSVPWEILIRGGASGVRPTCVRWT